MTEILPWAVAVIALLVVLALLLRPGPGEALRGQLTELDHGLRREIATSTRDGMGAAFQQVMAGNAAMQTVVSTFRTQVTETLEGFGRAQTDHLDAMGKILREADERSQRSGETLAGGLRAEQERLRTVVGEKLDELRAGNEAKLETIRAAVDETLRAALEKQVGESFQRVTEQFAEVQKAIGQVQSVASQVGDLKRLFSNVKSRGGWGEAQVDALLQDALPAGSFARNVTMRDGSGERVEFALRMPARGGPEVWLAIDAKFPTEDYDRLLLAAEAGSREDETAARKGLDRAIRDQAARIAKYIVPPRTVAFAVMYLPTDGLFAEVARTPGLIEQIRRDHKVMVMGPSLLPALLHTLRVGHETVVLEQKAHEIGDTLSAVKAEWTKFGEALQGLEKQAGTLVSGFERIQVRRRAVDKTLRGLSTMEPERATALLGTEAEDA